MTTIATPSQPSETSWLKSPLSEKRERLHPLQDMVLRPYYGAKKRLRLLRTRYTIGSSKAADIFLDDPFISPIHAELLVLEEGEGYLIRDLSSRNGVFLNGVKVMSAPLPSQGNLRLGRSTLHWSTEKEEEAEEHDGNWIVADPIMKDTLSTLKRAALSNLPILLLGETGTGKEILARLIHSWSPRSSGPYLAVNGALTGGSLAESELFGHKKGAFTGAESSRLGAIRSANGGTLFLDEVADIPLAAQVKLLRCLEGGEVKALGSDHFEKSDFRLVAATSQDLEAKVEGGQFRADLYYRVAGVTVRIPPLRERPMDIQAIARKLLEQKGIDLDKEAEAKLLSYRWPGNVRELRSAVERSVLLARAESSARVLPHHFPDLGMQGPRVPQSVKKGKTLEELEREWIEFSLERNGWSRKVAARELGIARSTLFEKMRKFGIKDAPSMSR